MTLEACPATSPTPHQPYCTHGGKLPTVILLKLPRIHRYSSTTIPLVFPESFVFGLVEPHDGQTQPHPTVASTKVENTSNHEVGTVRLHGSEGGGCAIADGLQHALAIVSVFKLVHRRYSPLVTRKLIFSQSQSYQTSLWRSTSVNQTFPSNYSSTTR